MLVGAEGTERMSIGVEEVVNSLKVLRMTNQLDEWGDGDGNSNFSPNDSLPLFPDSSTHLPTTSAKPFLTFPSISPSNPDIKHCSTRARCCSEMMSNGVSWGGARVVRGREVNARRRRRTRDRHRHCGGGEERRGIYIKTQSEV